MIAQTSASTSASSSFGSDSPARVSVGGFAFESGATLAVEIARDGDSRCLPDPVFVERWVLLGANERRVSESPAEPQAAIADWIGIVPLRSESQPLPPGHYALVLTTSVGEFRAEFEIADSPAFARFGRFSVEASVCGLSLRLYRLLTDEDHGAQIALRQGDLLMVALPGNITTGYEWTNTLSYEYAVLREIAEREYRPDPVAPGIVGSGGTFLFRYRAIAPDEQAFRFVYQRPWESVQPAQIVEFTVRVH